MISITIDASAAYPLVDQIVAGIRRQIDERCLRPGIFEMRNGHRRPHLAQTSSSLCRSL